MAAPPAVNRRIVEALVESRLPDPRGRRLLLVHGRYEDTLPVEFRVHVAGSPRRVRVSDQNSVLGIVEAWQEHLDADPDGDDVLVVTTGLADAALGWDLRGYAVRGGTQTVDRLEIIKHRFTATDIDPRIRTEPWLVDALLDAEPATGWPRVGSVLTRDAAVRALILARLGEAEFGNGTLDAGTLLAWSQRGAGPERFAELPAQERDGLTAWLAETVGDTARVVMGLAAAGRAADVLPLGLLGAAATQRDATAEAAMAFGGLLGTVRPRTPELRVFVEAVEGTVERWIGQAESGGPHGEAARRRVLDVLRRADDLAATAELSAALAGSRFLPSAFQARLRTLAGTLTPRPDAAALSTAENALVSLTAHEMTRLFPERQRAATMAVRLMRWLVRPEDTIGSVAEGVRRHIAEWGWVDRALNVVWAGDTGGDPVVANAYRAVYEAARARRDTLDEAFARRLVTWTAHASTQAPGDCLLVEQVLERVAVPLSGESAPLVVVLDGMSSAVAAQLGEALNSRVWTEVSPEARRASAVAAIPSVTRVSRASLLTGVLTEGDQDAERKGFAAFWRRHRRDGVLFHKKDLAGHAGHRLAGPLVEALAGDAVVGVVLNTIDEALDHGREGDRTGWRLTDLTYLPELLDAARDYGRPVVLVADHGHVLDRSSTEDGPTAASGVEAARWRTGNAEAGEVELAGLRVIYGDGRVVVPWREDIRYTPRKAGYHGGASLAEMTVPVLTLLPAVDLLPSGWSVLPPESVAPEWWAPRHKPAPTVIPAPPAGRRPGRKKPAREAPDVTPLFTVEGSTPTESAETLGTRVVNTEAYAAQQAFVRRRPDKSVVAAVIDTLIAADNRLSLTALVAKAGRAGRNPEGFAETLRRLLNVEGYPVLSLQDGGRTVELNVELLRLQFGVTAP
ncbi:BREX-2 system phosphatase PglZ [Gandjariella thermophila]|uniref:Uncharacterized protein n=1 Tax=Gandjariella thermophila TaxID=1931992 RepID=A0A4D4JIT7_9PSEU|nr:BREX-2 system phosphatase PglZ [Gandjariella thermophila]GDY33797.1 hypothetical protein GTS_54300 [Gandjariella thermophila]